MQDQQTRLQMYCDAPPAVRQSSLATMFGGKPYLGVIQPLRDFLTIPVQFLAMAPMPFVVLMLVVAIETGPRTWLGPKADINWIGYGVLAVVAVLVLNILDYVIDVLVRVPWKAPFSVPLAAIYEPFPRHDMRFAKTCFWVGGLGVLTTILSVVWNQVKPFPAKYLDGPLLGGVNFTNGFMPGVCFLALGLVLLFLAKREPAWPFVRMTWRERIDLFHASNANAQRKQTTAAVTGPAQCSNAPVANTDYAVPFALRYSDKTFADIHGMLELKDKLLSPAKLIVAPRADRQNGVAQTVPRNGILLHGEPGNGKTVFAEALAGELGVPLLEVTYGPIASKWIGEVPSLLTRTFELARNSAPCVLFIDEIDSFIKSRDSATSNTEAPIITNVILTELVKLRSSRVVVIGATNYLELLDAAAIREGRFDYKVEVTAPDEQARIGLLKEGVRRHASHVPVNEEQLIAVAQRWNGFSVARLNAVCQAVDDVAKKTRFKQFGHAEWMLALREVQGRRGRLPANTKSLGEMLFTEGTKSALDLIASRLKNVAQIEARGGSLPGGILFYGPPGTGKTAAARALAKEAGWAFLAVAGPDLIADRGRLAKTFAEAKDLRPTIVFIDEADDILRDRQFSQHSDMVNKLLTIMDGAEDKIKDLVWIAATNHPENVDPALLRAGRFSEKVLFSTPPAHALPNHITDWMKARKVALGGRLNVAAVAAKLEGQTIANVDGVLQYALNAAIHRGDFDGETLLVEADLDQAIRVVIGQADFV